MGAWGKTEIGGGREQNSSGREYARRLWASKLPVLGHSVCFFVDVMIVKDCGRARLNHANRQELIAVAESCLFRKIKVSLALCLLHLSALNIR